MAGTLTNAAAPKSKNTRKIGTIVESQNNGSFRVTIDKSVQGGKRKRSRRNKHKRTRRNKRN
jgi:hypothetical protein